MRGYRRFSEHKRWIDGTGIEFREGRTVVEVLLGGNWEMPLWTILLGLGLLSTIKLLSYMVLPIMRGIISVRLSVENFTLLRYAIYCRYAIKSSVDE